MADIKEIAVRVGADITPLTKGFQDASQKVKAFKGTALNVSKAVARIGLAAAGAGAAVIALSDKAAQSAREIKNLSVVAGTGTTEFQKLAFAAKTVGIEQDKLADIYKDTNDKIGDFLQTGAGPMADFFENIAPKVGVTANQFAKLSGPQALQLYVSSLEKANISQNEMTFYLEAIASDATSLLPLLQNNGQGFADLGERAAETGAVLSSLDISKLDQMKTSLDTIKESAETGSQAFAATFAPVIGALAEEFTRLRIETNNFGSAADKVFDFAVNAAGVMGDGLRGVHVIVKGLEVAFHGLSIGVNFVLGHMMKGLDKLANIGVSTINQMIGAVNMIPGVDDIPLFSAFSNGDFLLDGMETAKNNLSQSIDELHNIMMKPLPSQKIDEFVESAVQAYERAAEESAAAIDGGSDGEDSPIVQANKNVIHNMRQAWDKHHAESIEAQEKADKAKSDSQQKWGMEQTSALSGLFGNLASLTESENKKMFEIGKTAAKSQTLVDTYASAQSAFKSLSGIPIVGPALGAAAAGAAVVSGLARLQAINSTSFGGGGGAATDPGASVGSGASSQATAGQAGSGGAGVEQTLFVEGLDSQALFSGDNVRKIAEQLVEFQKDGGQVVLV